MKWKAYEGIVILRIICMLRIKTYIHKVTKWIADEGIVSLRIICKIRITKSVHKLATNSCKFMTPIHKNSSTNNSYQKSL